MDERTLENLKDTPVPPPRESAREAALSAALAAFDTGAKEISATTQDGDNPIRLTHASNSQRSFLMRVASRQNLALAASVAALMVAAPWAWHQIQREVHGLPHNGYEAEPLESSSGNARMIASPPEKTVPETLKVAKEADPNEPAPELPADAVKQGYAEIDAKKPEQARLAAQEQAGKNDERPADYDGLGVATGRLDKTTTVAAANVPAPAPPPARGVFSTDRQIVAGLVGEESGAFRIGGDSDQPRIAGDVEENRDRFETKDDNPVKQVSAEPVSTFSIDVDTASYSFVRRALNSGRLPPKAAVRVEEMINYFPYAYPAPESADTPFKPTVSVAPAPWNPDHQLVHIGLKGYDLKAAERPRANLVLLVDVSGSMEPADRLPLIKSALRLLVEQLHADDTVGIVTYASGSGVALEPTKVAQKSKILAAIDGLSAGGSTAGAQGIADAYRLAEANFDKTAVNRVMLATDGDFNVGITDENELKGFIERKRQSGIYLSILGVGEGNHNDALMQTLAQNGNGTAAYVDTLNEARKVLADETSSTLFTIAKDVKVQIEWNPARVAEYRLIGYETRALNREDFNNDKVDAGDIGSGHTVTAIYEITPVGAKPAADSLRYASKPASAPTADDAKATEIGFLKLRYKKPGDDQSQLVTKAISDALQKGNVSDLPPDARFSIAVAAFGQLLRGSPFAKTFSFDDVIALAQTARGDDAYGYRAEFLNLVRLAKSAQP